MQGKIEYHDICRERSVFYWTIAAMRFGIPIEIRLKVLLLIIKQFNSISKPSNIIIVSSADFSPPMQKILCPNCHKKPCKDKNSPLKRAFKYFKSYNSIPYLQSIYKWRVCRDCYVKSVKGENIIVREGKGDCYVGTKKVKYTREYLCGCCYYIDRDENRLKNKKRCSECHLSINE